MVSLLNGLPVVATASESLRVDRAAWPVYDQKNPTNIIGNRTHLPLKLAWAMTAQKAQGKHWVLWKFIVARNLLQATYMLLFQGLEVESSYMSLALISNDRVLLQRWCWTSSIIYAMFLQKKTVHAVAPRDKRCSLGTKDFDKEFLEEDWWG